jgi:predicted DNA-binding protein
MTVAKLTIKLPDELRRRTKAVAALRGETVSDVIREALQNYIAEAMEEADDVRAIREIEQRITAGKEKVHNWEDIEAELDDALQA